MWPERGRAMIESICLTYRTEKFAILEYSLAPVCEFPIILIDNLLLLFRHSKLQLNF